LGKNFRILSTSPVNTTLDRKREEEGREGGKGRKIETAFHQFLRASLISKTSKLFFQTIEVVSQGFYIKKWRNPALFITSTEKSFYVFFTVYR